MPEFGWMHQLDAWLLSKLVIEGNAIDLHYEVCPRKVAADDKNK